MISVFKAIGTVINSATRLIVKTISMAEDVVDTANVYSTQILNESLAESGVTKEELQAKYEDRLAHYDLQPKQSNKS